MPLIVEQSTDQSSGLRRARWRQAMPVGLFTLSYLIGATIAVFAAGNMEFVLYVGVLFVLLAVLGMVHLLNGLSTPLLWAMSIWGLAHMAGGLVPVPASWPTDGPHAVLYSWWLIPGRLKYDQVVHAYGFGVTTWLCWQTLRAAIATRLQCAREHVHPTFGLLTLCGAAGVGFGALNEVVEFAATLLLPDTNVGGYENTGWDLVSNSVGACVACCWIYFSGQAE